MGRPEGTAVAGHGGANITSAWHAAASHADHGPSPLQRLLTLMRPESAEFWTVLAFAAGVGVLSLAVPITVEALVGSVQGGNRAMYQSVVVLSLILLFCLGLAGAMRAWKIYIVEFIQRRLFVRVVGDLAHRLPRVATAAFDREHGPELVNRFFDVLTVQKAGSTLLLDGASVLIQAVVGLTVLAAWHPWLLGYNAVLLAALVFLVWVLGRGGITAKIQESYAKYAVAGWLEEMARHPLAFKQSAGQIYALDRADALAGHYLTTRESSFSILFRQVLFGIALQAVASSALLGMGGFLVIRNELNIGQLVAAELIVAVTVGSFVKLGKSLESYYDLMAASDKLGHLLDLPLERATGESLRGEGPARLEVSNVSFSYDDGEGHVTPALHNLSLIVEERGRVAVTGGSGSGKNTLVELLFGLREPTSGYIRLDGVDVRSIALSSLREQIVSVTCSEVFDGTVMENVHLGREGVGIMEVRAALSAVDLLDEVERLPQGFHTRLSTGGAPLSSGQAERLMIARAIAGKPRVLIINRLLDRLDAEKLSALLPALTAPAAPWTLLVVSSHPGVLAAFERVITLPSLNP